MAAAFTVRPLAAQDAPAVAALTLQSRPTTRGLIRFHTETNPGSVVQALSVPGVSAVAAEAPGHDGLVGMGWLSVGECWYEDSLRPYAYLYNAVVHPAYRRCGILRRMTAIRIEQVREAYGEDVLIFARIGTRNLASLRAAEWWSTHSVAGRIATWAVGLRRTPPRPVAGLEVRRAADEELDAFVQGQNECYQGCNFYSPRSPAALRERLDASTGTGRTTEYLVAADSQGRFVAGLAVQDSGGLSRLRAEYANGAVRAAAVLLRLAPADDLLNLLRVRDFWFAPGHAAAAAHLWQVARWRYRGRGHLLVISLDRRAPLAGAIGPALFRRATASVLRLAAPVPPDADRPIYAQSI